MASDTHSGYLFDLFARGSQMVLWFLTDDGEAIRLVEEFTPTVFVAGEEGDIEALKRSLRRLKDAEFLGVMEKLDFWTGEPRAVFALRVLDIENWKSRLAQLAQRLPLLSWYNADIMAEQLYCYDRNVFPLMRCTFSGQDGRLTSLTVQDDRWDTLYDIPTLRGVELSVVGSLLGRPRLESITLEHEGGSMTWDDPESMLTSFQQALDEIDPDVIYTEDGDPFLMPLLLTIAREQKFPLRLDREPPPREREIRTAGRTYMSYGRVLYCAPDYPLCGRWHIDRKSSFILGHGGIDGLIEVGRLARIPIQRLARRSIGVGITSVQLDMAYREGYLIPWKKTHPEAWKTGNQLLLTDRGGLVYSPEMGFHERVVELDFISMYPSIMSRFNVSPETINCQCCKNTLVPEIGYTICRKRRGLVSRSLAPIIQKRILYKKHRKAAAAVKDKEMHTRYDDRQCALKWMLVCCFGYLGYRNARFGRIEAHEAVSSFSRELLIVAREVCEKNGWRMLHANVDSVWIVKPDFSETELMPLCKKIAEATGLDIALEGIYKWITFLPSRQYPDRPVPTRYYGAFEDGTLKYRGIECRRHDLPVWVREAQLNLLIALATANDLEEYRARLPGLLDDIREFESMLWKHEVPVDQLVIRQSLSQAPDEYRGNGMQALAARQAARAGLNLHAGETLEFLIVDQTNEDRDQRVCVVPLADAFTQADPVAYIRLLRRAMNTLLWPMGAALEEEEILRPGQISKKKSRRTAKLGQRQLEMM